MNLVCKPIFQGIMAYWDSNKNAASYNVKLFINDKIISQRTNERTELYHTFTGLAPIDGVTRPLLNKLVHVCGRSSYPQHNGLDYYVQVEAEDRNGNIITSSEKVKCTVERL